MDNLILTPDEHHELRSDMILIVTRRLLPLLKEGSNSRQNRADTVNTARLEAAPIVDAMIERAIQLQSTRSNVLAFVR